MRPSPRGPALVCAAVVLAFGLIAAALLPLFTGARAGAQQGGAG